MDRKMLNYIETRRKKLKDNLLKTIEEFFEEEELLFTLLIEFMPRKEKTKVRKKQRIKEDEEDKILNELTEKLENVASELKSKFDLIDDTE